MTGLADALAGTIVLDLSRMLPGAVLARMLVSFGARVVKVEESTGGDPLRATPPIVDGIGTGFRTYFAGAESVCLDLRTPHGAAALRRLSRHADVLVESFRPGTLERWGLGSRRLIRANPGLVLCSLSSYGQVGERADRVGHDLNFVAESGLLGMLPGEGVPRVQMADVTAGLLACSSILAALLARARTGRGAHLDEPLARAAVPFLLLLQAEVEAGGGGITETLLAGAAPAYGIYECAGGERIALGALEPKFWVGLVEGLGLPDLAGAGLDTGDLGRDARNLLAECFGQRPREHWLAWAADRGLPITAVRMLAEVGRDPHYYAPNPSVRAVPRLGEHTESVLAEFGFARDEIDALRK